MVSIEQVLELAERDEFSVAQLQPSRLPHCVDHPGPVDGHGVPTDGEGESLCTGRGSRTAGKIGTFDHDDTSLSPEPAFLWSIQFPSPCWHPTLLLS